MPQMCLHFETKHAKNERVSKNLFCNAVIIIASQPESFIIVLNSVAINVKQI